jgi:hypothetical protein
VMQQRFPFLILRGFSEPGVMRLQGLPVHQQQILAGFLDAALQLMGNITRHAVDYFLRFAKGSLERINLTGLYIENRYLKNHLSVGQPLGCPGFTPGGVFRRRINHFSKQLLMIIGITKQVVDNHQALDIKAHGQLFGHTHTTMQLDGLATY